MTEAEGRAASPGAGGDAGSIFDPDAGSGSAGIVPPEERPTAVPSPPGVRELLGRSVEANLGSVREIRATSLAIGLVGLAIVGPVIAVHAVFAARIDALAGMSIADATRAIDALRAARTPISIADLIAVGCLIAVAIDCQLVSIEVIAARVLGHPFDRGAAFARARRRFWPILFADLLVGLILFVPRAIGNAIVAPHGVTQESQLVVVTLIGIVLMLPFSYVATWVELGRVGPSAAVAGSWRMTRRRPSLATAISVANTVVQAIALFAAGAAIGLLAGIGEVLGIDNPAGLGVAPDTVLIGALVIAAGSLFFTLSALAAAPQVVAYLGLGGPVAPDPAAEASSRSARRLVSRPMLLVLALELVLVVTTIRSIA